MWTKLICFCLVGSAFGQVPQGLTASVDYRNPPELPIILSWLDIPGATYNVYEAKNAGLTDASCPAAPTTPDSVGLTSTNYVENPNPGWWALPMTDGRWKGRVWCYWVTSVVNGAESAKAGPKSVTVGNAGYVFLGFRGLGTYSPIDKCLGGPVAAAPSTNLSDWVIELTYTPTGGITHYFQTENLFETNHQGTELGSIWHAPSIATDGFVIPWGGTGTYGYKFTYKPWGKSVAGFWSPRASAMWNYYTQINVQMLIDPGQADNGAQCTLGYFGTYDLMENVITGAGIIN